MARGYALERCTSGISLRVAVDRVRSCSHDRSIRRYSSNDGPAASWFRFQESACFSFYRAAASVDQGGLCGVARNRPSGILLQPITLLPQRVFPHQSAGIDTCGSQRLALSLANPSSSVTVGSRSGATPCRSGGGYGLHLCVGAGSCYWANDRLQLV